MPDKRNEEEAAEGLKTVASDAASGLVSTADAAAEELKITASDVANDVKQTATRVAHVVKELSQLTAILTEQQAEQIRKIQRNAVFLTALICLCIILVTALGYAVHRINTNEQEIRALQTRTNSDVLCGLFTVFLNSYNENSIAAKEDLPRYRDGFNKIEEGAKTLGCILTTRRKD